MATSFDRWEKDPFFLAAEEVQESADRYARRRYARGLGFFFFVPVLMDLAVVFSCSRLRRMESVYKIWVQERSGGDSALGGEVGAVELRRELHTALGTAKWQVNLVPHCYSPYPSCRNCGLIRSPGSASSGSVWVVRFVQSRSIGEVLLA